MGGDSLNRKPFFSYDNIGNLIHIPYNKIRVHPGAWIPLPPPPPGVGRRLFSFMRLNT